MEWGGRGGEVEEFVRGVELGFTNAPWDKQGGGCLERFMADDID